MNTKTARATRRPKEERVSQILDAARSVIAEYGYEGALVAEVAARANVVEGTIYRYFETKRDLFVQVAELWFEEILAESEPMQAISGTLNRLRYLVWRELSIIRREPALTRFVLMELRPDPTYRSTRLYELSRKFTSGVLEVIKAAVKAGELRDDVPLQVVRDMVFGGIEHQTWAYLRNEGDFSVDKAANAIAEVIYHGMLRQAAQADIDIVTSRLEQVAKQLENAVLPPATPAGERS